MRKISYVIKVIHKILDAAFLPIGVAIWPMSEYYFFVISVKNMQNLNKIVHFSPTSPIYRDQEVLFTYQLPITFKSWSQKILIWNLFSLW
jgi:hypothetical protein